MTSVRRGPVAAFLFSSGACALIYQIVWTRELRHIFGASTTASAAVLAIFIGGLGAGGMVLGTKADKHPRPLMLYANLEAAIAITAAFTPLLLTIARAAYLGVGGATTLGEGGATIARLLLAVLVLGVPTFLMGGTLPAAVRAAQADDDAGRRHAAFLYGANTLGAVTGAAVSTFVSMEIFGAKLSLWMACSINLLVAMVARMVARSGAFTTLSDVAASKPHVAREAVAPARFVLGASLAVGFVFFLMELVWYRMLSPLLGGSLFTFGLILAVALLGIGLGGLAYALAWGDRPATLSAFAVTSLAEAAAIALPFALGDRIAFAALGLRPLSTFGFSGLVAGWGVIAMIVVFPAAFASGVQFPLLIALLGRGKVDVGRQVGLTYAWNTVGAITGSIAGGFGLMPLLSAPGCWRFVALALAAIGTAAAALHAVRSKRLGGLAVPALLVVTTLVLAGAEGPTAVWRHSPIGAGRVPLEDIGTADAGKRWIANQRSRLTWEREGREVGLAVGTADDRTFYVNGKADGSFRIDSATQVMAGLVGACLHGAPKSAYVIGLGTGQSAGWLADFPTLTRLDVAEIEPSMLDVARLAGDVNRHVLDNRKVHVELLDAREGLLTKRHRYDLVFSEPSNPYRAGISSLFTEEFYRAAEGRLEKDGLFLQWVQGYEIDAETLRSVYATLGAVFPVIETWVLDPSDFLLVASREPIAKDADKLRACTEQPLMREAMRYAWNTGTLEGFLSHHVARPSFARHMKQLHGARQLNSDDLNPLEFGVARSVGRTLLRPGQLQDLATSRDERRPEVTGKYSRALVEEEALSHLPFQQPGGYARPTPERRQRIHAAGAAMQKNFEEAREAQRAGGAPITMLHRLVVGYAYASLGEPDALVFVAPLAESHPGEVAAVEARFALTNGETARATDRALDALRSMRESPWFHYRLGRMFLEMLPELTQRDPAIAARLADAVRRPFAAGFFEFSRRDAVLRIAELRGLDASCREVADLWGDHAPFTAEVLVPRAHCLKLLGDKRYAAAQRDLDVFNETQPILLDPAYDPLAPPPPPSASALPGWPVPSASAPAPPAASSR